MITDRDLQEIKRLKELRHKWLTDPAGFTVVEIEEDRLLSNKWNPIDVSRMLLDELDKLREQNRIMLTAIEMIKNNFPHNEFYHQDKEPCPICLAEAVFDDMVDSCPKCGGPLSPHSDYDHECICKKCEGV